jgi:predicted metal-dependent phosphoesterase TrpH
LELEFDFIAITDHYAFSNEGCIPVIQLCQAETRLLCIPGEEVFVRSPILPHLLALGIQSNIGPAPLETFVEEIHRQGGLAVAAHPSDPLYTDDELYGSGLDAMECARGSQEYDQRQWELSEEYNLPCVYNSDAHVPEEMGRRFNVCTVPINNIADLKEALTNKQCEMNSANH